MIAAIVIHDAWWLLALGGAGLVVCFLAIALWGEDASGSGYFLGPGIGCLIGPLALVAGVVLGLLGWALRITLAIGGGA